MVVLVQELAMKHALVLCAVLLLPIDSIADDCLNELEAQIEKNWAQSEAAKRRTGKESLR